MTTPVLLLDVMGTLVTDPFFKEMPAFFGLTFEEMLRDKQPGPWVSFERGQITETDFLNRFFSDHTTFDHEAFMEHVSSGYGLMEGMGELLEALLGRGIPMHAFSNYPLWYHRIERKLRLSRYLRWSFVSCETGFRKPDLAAYQHAVDTLQVPAKNCIFVDDRQSNCDAAREIGMTGIRFDGVSSLRASFESLGVL